MTRNYKTLLGKNAFMKDEKRSFPSGSAVKNQLVKQEMWVRSLGQDDPLEKEMAIQSSILAWEIPWTEEPGGLRSMDSHIT